MTAGELCWMEVKVVTSGIRSNLPIIQVTHTNTAYVTIGLVGVGRHVLVLWLCASLSKELVCALRLSRNDGTTEGVAR